MRNPEQASPPPRPASRPPRSLLQRWLFPLPPPPLTRYFSDYVRTLPSLAGKTVAVTGCTSCTGFVLARTCGQLGARVLMLNRPSERAQQALQRLQAQQIDALHVPCDLQLFASVRAAAEQLDTLCQGAGLDVLCNNAGVMGLPDEATPDGFDVQMQSNHLSHFLLTSLVWPALERAVARHGEARVVNHSSGARRGPALQARYLQKSGGALDGDGFPGMAKWRRYQQSKLANLLFTYALHERVVAERPAMAHRIKSVCAHPGPTDSGLQGKTEVAGGTRLLDAYILWRALKEAHTVEDGSMGIVRGACDPAVRSLDFYGPRGAGKAGPAELMAPERDAAAEALLWAESLRATGISRFFG